MFILTKLSLDFSRLLWYSISELERAPPVWGLLFEKIVQYNRIKEASFMEPIPDDPIIRSLEDTGYPPWYRGRNEE